MKIWQAIPWHERFAENIYQRVSMLAFWRGVHALCVLRSRRSQTTNSYSPSLLWDWNFSRLSYLLGCGSNLSIIPLALAHSETWCESPASIAGVTRRVLWIRQKL